MNLAIELLVIGLVVPAAIAGLLTWILPRIISGQWATNYAATAAVVIAFVISYALLPEWAALKPERHWQWLPLLAIAAHIVGSAGMQSGQSMWLRAALLAVLAAGAAYLLVPTWPDLQPPRFASILLVAIYLASLMRMLDWLSPSLSATWLLAVLTLTAAILAVILAIDVVRFGQLAGIGAAALAGCWIAVVFTAKTKSFDRPGLSPVFAVLVGGMAYVGCIEPAQPAWWLLLLPALVLPLGLAAAKLRPYRASASSAQ
jgi:hypothetical protein